MKLMEIKEIELNEMGENLKKARLELVDLRMKFTSRQLENPSLIKKKRKDIARMLTIQTQKLHVANAKTETKTKEKDESEIKTPHEKIRKTKEVVVKTKAKAKAKEEKTTKKKGSKKEH